MKAWQINDIRGSFSEAQLAEFIFNVNCCFSFWLRPSLIMELLLPVTCLLFTCLITLLLPTFLDSLIPFKLFFFTFEGQKLAVQEDL